MSTLEAQSNGPLYGSTAIGTLAVDLWAVTFGTAMRGPGGAAARAPPGPLIAVPNVTPHKSMASVPTSYYLMWHPKGSTATNMNSLKGKQKRPQ